MKDGKIQSFTDLKVWQEGHKLVILVYKLNLESQNKIKYNFVLVV